MAADDVSVGLQCMPRNEVPDLDDAHLYKALEYVCAHTLRPSGQWGIMDADVWNEFVTFVMEVTPPTLRDGRPRPTVHADEIWTNELLQAFLDAEADAEAAAEYSQSSPSSTDGVVP
jgi:hypothetical protein